MNLKYNGSSLQRLPFGLIKSAGEKKSLETSDNVQYAVELYVGSQEIAL